MKACYNYYFTKTKGPDSKYISQPCDFWRKPRWTLVENDVIANNSIVRTFTATLYMPLVSLSKFGMSQFWWPMGAGFDGYSYNGFAGRPMSMKCVAWLKRQLEAFAGSITISRSDVYYYNINNSNLKTLYLQYKFIKSQIIVSSY